MRGVVGTKNVSRAMSRRRRGGERRDEGSYASMGGRRVFKLKPGRERANGRDD